MKHAQFKEWLHLSVVDELNDDARHLLDAHLSGCSECRDELKELLKFHSVIAENPPVEVTGRLLQEARQQLHLSLLEYRLRKPFWEQAALRVRDFVVREYKIAFGGIATAALGVFVGYVVFSQPPKKLEENAPRVETPVVEQAMKTGGGSGSFTQGDTRTSDLHLIEAGGKDVHAGAGNFGSGFAALGAKGASENVGANIGSSGGENDVRAGGVNRDVP